MCYWKKKKCALCYTTKNLLKYIPAFVGKNVGNIDKGVSPYYTKPMTWGDHPLYVLKGVGVGY